ncbi:MAG TPA: branched-chain amino acid ABC transporter permease [Geminicoccaceae bacterium]|nr:branched-chain amino acid ABC transporter permease [Geminicoccus sp.]HMU51655.1 branched-chain amino acid ABC transporter permease [Geminicoccaceae bacterium]
MRRCRELLPVFVEGEVAPRVEIRAGSADAPTGVRLAWGDDWIVCWFLPLGQAGDAWQIHQVQSSRFGTLSRYDVQQAYKMLRVEAYPDAGGGRAGAGLYWLQQTVNGLSLGCVYALIAIGYTLVYGITGVINFAYGPLYTVGAFVLVACWAGTAAGLAVPVVLALGALGGAITGAAFGWAMDRAAFRPLRMAQRTVPMIAAIGLAMALQEWIRLSQGPRTRYVLVAERTTWPLLERGGFTVYVSLGHLLVGAGTLLVGGWLWWLHRRSRFGRMQRATAQDQGMARLLGIDVDGTIARTFALGGALAGLAGVFAAGQYGVVTFRTGALIGLKALTAAILGGIGSLPGAAVGAMLVALCEAYTAAYLSSEWREVAVFGLLVLVLVLRPQGLLGTLPARPADERDA